MKVVTFVDIAAVLIFGGISLAANQFLFRALLPYLRDELPGLCPSCGYNLTGNTSGVCPECGTEMMRGK